MSIQHYIEKFILLSWKLHRTQWNRFPELIWLVLSPIFMCFIAYYFRFHLDLSHHYNVRFEPVDMEEMWNKLINTLKERDSVRIKLNKSHNVFMPKFEIGWAPNGYNIFEALMVSAVPDLHSMKMLGFADCTKLEQVMQTDYLFAGVCFDTGRFEKQYEFVDGRLSPREMLLASFNYTIIYPSELRIFDKTFIGDDWKTEFVENPTQTMAKRLNDPDMDGLVCYFREGFMQIQLSVSGAYLNMISPMGLPKINMRRFPTHTQKHERLMFYIHRTLPLVIIVGYLFPAQILVWQVVQEKQRQMRLFLINMNISNIIHYTSWFLKGLAYLIISTIGAMAILKLHCRDSRGLLTQTPWYIVLYVLSSYSVAVTSFSLMIASFFKNSALAMRVLTLMWLLTYMPFCVLYSNREQSLQLIRYISYAMPNTVLSLIFEALLEREIILDEEWSDDAYTLNYTFHRIHVYKDTCIFLVTALVYCVIGMYMDVWNTGETTGRRRKHIAAPAHSGEFTFQDNEDSFVPQTSQVTGVKSTKIYEVEPSHRRFKIKIKKLCKRFTATGRGVLNSFTWNVYENEVTVLMGHNGCGKTTLLKILAGLLEPTRGLVNVADYNIQTERHNASKQLGLALSDDLLLPDFTVYDQIRFIGAVKGLSWAASGEQAKVYTEMLHLTHVQYRMVKALTGQERNLLNIACAFVGGSPIILMDDLHADLDVPTQSLICNLINEEKSKRTIILVSNSTPLANHLADRLAIMSNGELKCTGTKPFLRNMYGHGFRLTCVKGKTFDLETLIDLLQQYVPIIGIESNIGFKVTFVLENKYEDKFTSLFDVLENEMVKLDIVSFRLRDTSLDEIFLRFGSEEGGDLGTDQMLLIEDFKLNLEESDATARATGRKLTKMVFKSLFYMRWLYYKRQLPITILYVLSMLMVTSCTFSAFLVFGKNYQLKPLSFNLTQLHYINAFVERMSDKMLAIEMQDLYTELVFWYDGRVKLVETTVPSDFYLWESGEFNKIASFQYMFGASIGSDTITVWWNSIPLHAAPFALNLVHNVLARRYFNEEASIDVTLNPLPFQSKVNTFPQAPITLGSLLAINLTFMFANMWPALVANHKLDRSYKRQQLMAGVHLSTYILSTILYDLIRVIFLSLWLILMISVYVSPRHDFKLYSWVFLLLVMSGFSLMSLSYLFTTLFGASYYAFIVICFMNLFGIILFSFSVGENLEEINDWYKLFPQYTFATIIFKLFYIFDFKWLCRDADINFMSVEFMQCQGTPNCCKSHEYADYEYLAIYDMIAMALYTLIPLGLYIMEEQYTLMSSSFLRQAVPRKCVKSEKQDQQKHHDSFNNHDHKVDQTVIDQRNYVENLSNQERSEMAAVCQNVAKKFRKKSVLIRVDLCINKSECIGIMGYNNTGKTLLTQMIVGEIRPSHGNIWIGGYSMEGERAKCYPLMSYCSQENHLPDDYTPCELLHTHAQLHGMGHEITVQMCETLSHLLGFSSCYRQLVRVCTAGQHRRIAFALAIIGDPMLVCIDGAPGGIDPNGKRTLYALTALMQHRGSAFLYTNLSGLDCERMCQSVPMLFDGQFWTMGTQALRYRSGYLLEVRFKRKINTDFSTARSTWERINQFPSSPHSKFLIFMHQKFPEATLESQNNEGMGFFMPQRSTKFSQIFSIIRKDEFELNIEDFYITRNIVSGLHTDLFDRSALKIAPSNTSNLL